MKNIMTVQIKRVGIVWKIVIRGVVFKKSFLSYEAARNHLAQIHDYFGDETSFVEAA